MANTYLELNTLSFHVSKRVSMDKSVNIEVYDFFASDAVGCFGVDELLDEIGKEEVMKYFDLVEKE